MASKPIENMKVSFMQTNTYKLSQQLFFHCLPVDPKSRAMTVPFGLQHLKAKNNASEADSRPGQDHQAADPMSQQQQRTINIIFPHQKGLESLHQ